MARNTSFGEVVLQLQAEVRQSSQVALNVDGKELLRAHIRRVQKELYDEYDWPFFNFQPEIPLAAGLRYYDIPATTNLEAIEKIVLKYSGTQYELTRGIDEEQYRIFDSSSNVRSNPVRRFDIKWTGTKEQLEVWPMPDGLTPGTLVIYAKRNLRALVDDNDKVDLDDTLIVLKAASELLAARKAPDAQIKERNFQNRLARLKGRSKVGESRSYIMGSGTNTPPDPPGSKVIIGT